MAASTQQPAGIISPFPWRCAPAVVTKRPDGTIARIAWTVLLSAQP